MKMIIKQLMMCTALTGLTSEYAKAADARKTVRLHNGKEMGIQTPEQSADMRDAMYHEQTMASQASMVAMIRRKTENLLAAAESNLQAAQQDPQPVRAHFNAERERVSAIVESQDRVQLNALYLEFKRMKDAITALKGTIINRDVTHEKVPSANSDNPEEKKNAGILKSIEFIEKVARFIDTKVEQGDFGSFVDAYMLLDSYACTGSVFEKETETVFESADSPYMDNLRSNAERRAEKERAKEVKLAAESNCPDQAVLGRTVKELFPHFSRAAFNRGMAATSIVTGDRAPMTTVKLSGKWYKVYAMDTQTQPEGESFTPAPGTIFYWPTSIRQVVAPYASRFSASPIPHGGDAELANADLSRTSVNALLAENGQFQNIQGQWLQPAQSVAAQKLHRAVTSPDSGIFWQRDTALDDGQSRLCTYTSSSYTGAPRQDQYGGYGANFERTDCTFVLEQTEAPTVQDFDARKNGFMQRVYAQRRAYYMRHQGLGHYQIDPQDDPVQGRAKMIGEFKERIARDRIYQLNDPEQRRADGRIYAVTPSRIYMSTRNIRETVDPEAIALHNSFEANKSVYLHGVKVRDTDEQGTPLTEFDKEWAMGDSTKKLAKSRFAAMTRKGSESEDGGSASSAGGGYSASSGGGSASSAGGGYSGASVSHAAMTAAERRAENALSRAAMESSGGAEHKGSGSAFGSDTDA